MTPRRTAAAAGRLMAAALAVLLCFCGACSTRPGAPAENPAPAAAPGTGIEMDTAFRTAATSLAVEEILRAGAHSPTMKDIQQSGLLVAALQCDRPPLCEMNKYGVARGFEVDILRQAAQLFGVKLNVVPPGGKANLSGPVIPEKEPGGGTTQPYFFSTATGWLAFRVEADPAFASTMDLLVRHLYETGTYQQLYANWFGESAGGEGGR